MGIGENLAHYNPPHPTHTVGTGFLRLLCPRWKLQESADRQEQRKVCPLKSARQQRGSGREHEIQELNDKATCFNTTSQKQISIEKSSTNPLVKKSSSKIIISVYCR